MVCPWTPIETCLYVFPFGWVNQTVEQTEQPDGWTDRQTPTQTHDIKTITPVADVGCNEADIEVSSVSLIPAHMAS